MNYEELKETIVDNVFENTSQQITGQALQDTLIAMVDSLGAGYQFIGIATPDTNPGTIDHKAFWLTSQLGTYTHMGGVSLSSAGELGVIYYDGEGYSIDTIPTNFPYIASAIISQDGKTLVLTDQDGDETSLNIFTDAERTKLSDLPTNDVLNDTFAKKDGFYETLGAGYSRSLLGTGASVPATITRRPAGGTADIASGVASFKGIKGNTVVWNQMARGSVTDYGVSVSMQSDGRFKVTGTATATGAITLRNISLMAGHKYAQIANEGGVYIQYGLNRKDSFVFAKQTADESVALRFAITTGETYDIIAEFNLFDLTRMFGAGNEPASLDDERIKWLMSLHAPYNAGELLSLNAQSIVTDGFNAFDIATGKARVLALTPSAGQAGSYQIVGAYTSITQDGEAITPDSNGFFTPKGGEVVVAGGDDTTCIHIVHSGTRNGEYEPYWQATKNLNLTTLKGKLNGQGESVTIFPQGMRSAGTAFDELIVENGNIVKAVKRIGAYTITEESEFVMIGASSCAIRNIPNFAGGGVLMADYAYVPNMGASLPDKSVSDSSSATIWVKDSSLTQSVDAYKAALIGKTILYKLATPQTYTLDEPVSASYRVDDFGTESIAPLTDEDGNPATAPMVADIVYGPNVQDAIRRMPTLYLSIADYKAGIGNLATALGTSLDKTIAVEWGGENDSVPTFTITDNA